MRDDSDSLFFIAKVVHPQSINWLLCPVSLLTVRNYNWYIMVRTVLLNFMML
jgi:hypothetical protein